MARKPEKDSKIVELLRQNARMPNVEIARRVGLSEGAVRKRIASLVREGIIKRFTIETAEEEKALNALCFVSVEKNASTGGIAKRILELEGVRKVFEVTGEFDLAVLISGNSAREVNSVVDGIRGLNGVKNTDTRIVLKTWG